MSIIRDARPEDAQAIATLWHDGWKDGHDGLVPEGIYRHRTPESFLPRSLERVPDTQVVYDDAGNKLLGFVTVKDGELEQFFLHRDARGTGLSKTLMERGEQALKDKGVTEAYLVVVEGNARAIGFYEKTGWHNAGLVNYRTQTEDGPFDMPCLKFTKKL